MKIDAQKIKSLRERRGQTQAEFAKSSGLGESTVKYWESGKSKRVRPETVFRIAKRLRVRSDQVLSPLDHGAGLKALPRFLDQQVFPNGPAEVLDAMREAAIADMNSDFHEAHLGYEKALERVGDRDAATRAPLFVRYVTSLDNSAAFEKAAVLLEKQLKGPVPRAVALWGRYHLALAYRHMAERSKVESYLGEAQRIFREVERCGDTKQRVAAVHQLGCVFLVRASRESVKKGRTALLRKAYKYFGSAARRWRKMENFREGYALRRLAEIAEHEGRLLDAHRDLIASLEVFVRHDCYRYADEVREHIKTLVRKIADGHA